MMLTTERSFALHKQLIIAVSGTMGCIWSDVIYIDGVMSEVAAPPIVYLSSEYDPDGY
ncbi:hypothetical protein J2X76_000410 [Neorhizobium sp. 2083]|nr:hypothetical protein [Neorhizobium sp. 2083]